LPARPGGLRDGWWFLSDFYVNASHTLTLGSQDGFDKLSDQSEWTISTFCDSPAFKYAELRIPPIPRGPLHIVPAANGTPSLWTVSGVCFLQAHRKLRSLIEAGPVPGQMDIERLAQGAFNVSNHPKPCLHLELLEKTRLANGVQNILRLLCFTVICVRCLDGQVFLALVNDVR
jgi:hypothetical protein